MSLPLSGLRQWAEQSLKQSGGFGLAALEGHQRRQQAGGAGEHDGPALDDPVRERVHEEHDAHERDQRHHVHDALDHDRCQGRARRNTMLFSDHIGAQHFAQVGRHEAVCGIADHQGREQAGDVHGLDGRQQIPPAPRPQIVADQHHADRQQHIPVLRLGERAGHLGEIDAAQRQVDANGADEQADGELDGMLFQSRPLFDSRPAAPVTPPCPSAASSSGPGSDGRAPAAG